MNHEKEIVDFETGELEIVNDNFVQLYIDKLDLIMEMMSENPTATKVFTWLLKHMDKKGSFGVAPSLSSGEPVAGQLLDFKIKTIQPTKKG